MEQPHPDAVLNQIRLARVGGTAVKIMVVEDDELVALSVETFLRHHGHEVSGPYASSEEVFRAVRNGRPDCVLMDINLRGAASGLDCAQVLFKRFRIPVVFLSSDPDKARQGDRVALAYIAKPVSGRGLLASIQAVRAMIEGRPLRYVPPEMTVFRAAGCEPS